MGLSDDMQLAIAGLGFVLSSAGRVGGRNRLVVFGRIHAALLHHRTPQLFLRILQPAEIQYVFVAQVLHCLQRGLRAAT